VSLKSIDSAFLPNRNLFRVGIGIVACLLIAPSAVGAAPAMKNCDEPDSGERIKCKFDNLLDQQQATVDMLGENESIPPNQRQSMKNRMIRSQRTQGRAAPQDVKQLTKRSKTECQVSEIIGDGLGDDDGICKGGNEDCVEVLDDGIGDDDGICQRTGKPSEREVCAQICDAEAINANPNNFDDDPSQDSLGRDLEEQLSESTEQFAELNDTLESEMAVQASFHLSLANGDPCAAIFESRPSFEASLIASQLAVTLRGIAGQAQPVCQFDISGFNGAIACVITETIAAIAEVIDDSIGMLDEKIDSDTIDASYACLGDLNASVGETNDALTDIMSELDDVQNDLDLLQKQIAVTNQLLVTPQGQREGFNK
jgi:hypothetical protein